LAPNHIPEERPPGFLDKLASFLPEKRTALVSALVIAAGALLAWAFVPAISRRLANMPVYRRPIPATGPAMDNGNGNGHKSAQKVAPARFFGGPRQVSLQLKASEPNLRRSVMPVTKPAAAARPFNIAPTIAPAPMVEAPIHFAPQSVMEAAAPAVEPAAGFEAVGPVVEQGGESQAAATEMAEAEPFAFTPAFDACAPTAAPTAFAPAPAQWEAPAPFEWNTPEETAPSAELQADVAPVAEPEPVAASETTLATESFANAPVVDEQTQAEPMTEPAAYNNEADLEPIGQGQPVPYEMPVFEEQFHETHAEAAAPVIETPEVTAPAEVATVESAAPVEATAPAEAASAEVLPPLPFAFASDSGMNGNESLREAPEASFFSPPVVSTEPSVLQSTIPETMPEPTQTQNAPVIRTPATGGTSQPASAMHTAVQLTFSFEIASMQLTQTFKMGALQLRPTSKIVTMRLAPSQQPQPAMNLQVTFEISKIQPSGGGLGTIRLSPSQQQRPNVVGSPSFNVAGMQLVSNFESAPVQLTPSQQASVQVTGAFQIATVEFSPSFEIASIVLNSSGKQVAVQLPGAGSVEGAARFDIANLQLGPSGDIGMMQLNLAGGGR
jgi:hypothetical protein